MEADQVPTHSLDQFFAVPSDARRRHVLSPVADLRGGTDVDDIARSIASLEGDRARTEPPSEAVRSGTGSFRRVHLPTLAAAGLDEYDVDAGPVARRRHPAWERTVVTATAAPRQGVNVE